MGFPGEELVAAAVDTLSEGLIKKMDAAEAKRDREFSFRLKELEFYKSNYDKELKDIFDFWFDAVRVTHIKDNKNLTAQEKEKYEKKYKETLSVDKVARYKMNTLKYGGTETGRVFALESKLHQKKYKDQPDSTALYMWCAILSVLKKEILGQDLDPLDIIQVLVNDYDDNEKQILNARKYIEKVYSKTYGEKPYWTQY